MAQAAYELERFAPAKRGEAPRVRVAGRQVDARREQRVKMVRTLLAGLVVVLLVCAVLYTQTVAAELQGEITSRQKQLAEQKALGTWLNFELDNMSSLKNIEAQAKALGMEKIGGSQITYFRASEENSVSVKEDALSNLFADTENGLLSIWSYITGERHEE